MSYGKTPLNNSFASRIDAMINVKKKKHADYHKVIFHIHTPESHDYKLYEKNTVSDYKALTDQDMMDIAIQEGLFTIEHLTLHDLKEFLKQYKEFDSVKEFLAFLLMAKKLSDENIRLAIITDHNTISGYSKLVKAISIFNRQYPSNTYTEISLGIEISCADKCHVVGVFSDKIEIEKKLCDWILENIMDPESGTYKTSLDVLNDIEELGGIGYIAHVNTSNIFKPAFLSGGYKRHLFNSISHKILGVSQLDAIPTVRQNLKNYTKGKYKFVLDEDSHSLDTLASKCFWMKGQKVNFSMLKNAIKDFDISIEYTEPEVPNVFIKGIVVDEGGFLSGENGRGDFSLLFSESLNCLIGGRGTGKSTILNTINFVLSQNVNDESVLRNICKQGRVCVVCSYNNEDYYILFQTPVMDGNDSILRHFNNDHDNYKYEKRFQFNKDDIKEVTLNNYIQIFKKTFNENEPYIEEITRDKKKLLSHFFYKRYSVNELVRTSSTDEITSFILEMMFKNNVVSTRMRVGNITTLEGIKRKYKEIPSILKERKDSVHAIINEFNSKHTNKLRIIYNQDILREYRLKWVEILKLKGIGLEEYFEKFNVQNEDLIYYLSVLCEKSDPIKVFILFCEGKFAEIQNLVNLNEYTSPLSPKQIELGIQEITQENIRNVFEIIRERVLQKGLFEAIELIKKYLLYFDEFDLEFNINNMESNRDIGKVFKSVKELSFVLSYSDYSNDYTPLIIDQPEDNLDNRYIYKNLVADLRFAKSKRQVIIATHNSTIVTNSKAEQVIVLSSNNKNGWIESTGYPTEKSILTNIVNILEGGVESFKHKQFLYETILNRSE